MPIPEYFGFSHVIHLLLEVFPEFDFIAGNPRSYCPSSRSYWFPLQKLLTIAFLWNFVGSFFAYVFLTSSEIWKTKLPARTRCWSIFISGNGRSTIPEQTPWWQCTQKNARHVFMFYSYQYLKMRQAQCSTAGCVWTTWATLFTSQLYSFWSTINIFKYLNGHIMWYTSR